MTSAAPAHAAGWGTTTTASVGTYRSSSAWTSFTPFKPTPGATYRYCVVGRGTTTANLQPTAFGTIASFTNGSTLVTRCTKSWKTPSNHGSTIRLAGAENTPLGSVHISTVYVQRYYTGWVPV